MTRAEILAGVAQVAREHVGFDGALGEEQRLLEDLGLDSLRLVVLAAEVENRFRVALTPEDDAAVRTVGDLVTLVEAKLAR
ncbi:MAG TPA: acyl carrier protein [Thermoanaerobaculia bacterium]|jgi:acyl carrier protein